MTGMMMTRDHEVGATRRVAYERRRSIRLQHYDYSQPGAYFVTVCTHQRGGVFGEIIEGAMRLNGLGRIASDEWLHTAVVRQGVELDTYVVMPNHLHVVILIGEATCQVAPTTHRNGPLAGSVGAIIGQYKSLAAKRINAFRKTPGMPVWQRNYYEHVIRNEDDLRQIREYVVNNPANWATDENNPDCTSMKGR